VAQEEQKDDKTSDDERSDCLLKWFLALMVYTTRRL
jgi:hypothetical protein